MRQHVTVLVFVVILSLFTGCSREKQEGAKTEEKETMVVQQEQQMLPEGHPSAGSGKDEGQIKGPSDESVRERKTAGHPANGGVKRDVKVPDEVKAKWKTVHLKVVDKEKKTEESFTINVGKVAPIKDSRFSIKVDVFLPHYTMYDTYISSKSNEPINPAVLVELLENGKSIKKGWVFANFTTFNSYKHDRYEIVLPPVSSPR